MLPTGLGIKALVFYGMLLAAFFAAPYMNLFFLLLSYLTVVGLFATLWTWRNLTGIDGEVVEVQLAPAGTGATVVLDACTRGRRSRFAVDCVLSMGRRRFSVAMIDVLRGSGRITGRLPTLPRGVHRIDRAWLQSKYPFGFVLVWRRIKAPSEVVVYPRPADLGSARTRAEMLSELCGSSVAPQGEMGPSGLREYREGDELRHVHWKSSARRGSLVVREWEGTAMTAIEMCLDRRAEPEALEEALSLVTALQFWARENKDLLVVHSQDHAGTYGEGHRPWGELLVWLAAVQALPGDGPPPPVTSPAVLRLPLNRHSREGAAVEQVAHA